jgi:hypothetical protein
LTETDVINGSWEFPGAGPAILAVAWCLAALRISDSSRHRLRDRHENVGLDRDILPLLEARGEVPTRTLMAELSQRAAMQHLRIAWERFAIDPSRNIALFSVDEGRWTFFRRYRYSRMATRISQALWWLSSLRIINDHGLTDLGWEILAETRRDPVEVSDS